MKAQLFVLATVAIFTTTLQGVGMAWPSVNPSKNRMVDGSGRAATEGAAQPFTLPFPQLPRKQPLPWMQRGSAFCIVDTGAMSSVMKLSAAH